MEIEAIGVGVWCVVGSALLPVIGRVILQRLFQVWADPDVIDHQIVELVLKHAIHSGDGLHQTVAAHGLVDIHGVYAGRVETGQPHIAHDHKF